MGLESTRSRRGGLALLEKMQQVDREGERPRSCDEAGPSGCRSGLANSGRGVKQLRPFTALSQSAVAGLHSSFVPHLVRERIEEIRAEGVQVAWQSDHQNAGSPYKVVERSMKCKMAKDSPTLLAICVPPFVPFTVLVGVVVPRCCSSPVPWEVDGRCRVCALCVQTRCLRLAARLGADLLGAGGMALVGRHPAWTLGLVFGA